MLRFGIRKVLRRLQKLVQICRTKKIRMTTPFFDKYKHKVLSIDELHERIGVFPRKKKLLCAMAFSM